MEGLYCKVCGEEMPSKRAEKKCKICNAPVCKQDQTNGICIHCWSSVEEETHKTIVLTKTLMWAAPLIALLFIPFWSSSKIWSPVVLLLLFTGYHFSMLHKLISESEKYCDPNWIKMINSSEFKELIEKKNPSRILMLIEATKKTTPAPPKTKIIVNAAEMQKPFINPDPEAKRYSWANSGTTSTNENYEYKYLEGTPCPECKTTIEFKNICAECEAKFCPECKQRVEIFSRRCICGYIFPDIEEEMFERFGKKEILIVDENGDVIPQNTEQAEE